MEDKERKLYVKLINPKEEEINAYLEDGYLLHSVNSPYVEKHPLYTPKLIYHLILDINRPVECDYNITEKLYEKLSPDNLFNEDE